MSDLDDDLLALAGISDSEDEIKTKKRLAESEDESEEDELVIPYPLENRYKDEEDRTKLLNMDEITREEILFERSQEMERYNEKKLLAERLSGRTKRNKTSRTDKLTELRKQRERKKRREESDDEGEYDEESEEQDEEDEDLGYGDIEDDVVWGNYDRTKYEDINKVTIGRSFLHQYYFYPEFEETVLDCYGRINLGLDKSRRPIYRMVKIIELIHNPEKKYKLPSFESDAYLVVSQNRKQTKPFPINIFSDSPITEDEFNRYVAELEKNNEEIDYQRDVLNKAKEIETMATKSLNDHEINEIINKKQSVLKTLNGYDAVFQKATLSDKLKIARQNNNEVEASKILKQLEELDTLLVETSSSTNSRQMDSMSKVNERNRKLNLENIRKAEIKSSQLRRTASKNDGDPFQRLKTVTRVFYQDIINQENQKAKAEEQQNLTKLLNEKTQLEKKIESSTYRVLGVMDRLVGAVDFEFDV